MDLSLQDSRILLQKARALLEPVLPVPSPLEGLPLELWLLRPIPVEAAADFIGLSILLTRKIFRDKLIQLDDKRDCLRLHDILLLGGDAQP